MRKMLLPIGAVSLAFTPVSFPTIAQAQSASGEVETCQALVDSDAYDSLGQCVSEMRTSPLGFCKFLKDLDIYPVFFFDESINDFVEIGSQGQCVSFIRGL
jgi:hypothetical protein